MKNATELRDDAYMKACEDLTIGCRCFKYTQSFDSEGRCQTCGRINQEVKKEMDDFNGKT